jgi:hypothetical protein
MMNRSTPSIEPGGEKARMMVAELAEHGLYDPRYEHDACGIGFVAHVDGRRNHRVLQMALEALCNHAHRGAVADDRKSGDGAGVLCQLPHEFFNRELRRMGIESPHAADLAVGQLFLNLHNGADRARAREIVREVLTELKLEVLTFRSMPVIEAALGRRAEQSRPWMEQVLIRRTEDACEAGDAFERLLYLARKKIARRARKGDVHRLYIASMSSRTIVYKGLVWPRSWNISIRTSVIPTSRRPSPSSTSATAPTPFPDGRWPSPFGCSVTTARSTRCRAMSTGCTPGRMTWLVRSGATPSTSSSQLSARRAAIALRWTTSLSC